MGYFDKDKLFKVTCNTCGRTYHIKLAQDKSREVIWREHHECKPMPSGAKAQPTGGKYDGAFFPDRKRRSYPFQYTYNRYEGSPMDDVESYSPSLTPFWGKFSKETQKLN